MTYWRLYYHLVWSTKNRQPLIAPQLELELYQYIIGKSDFLNCIVHGINGIEDHIHLVVSIPPTLAISEYAKKIKGSSSHYVNHSDYATAEKFGWQEGYGVFSLGYKQLNPVLDYVKNQKQHHQENTTNIHLEPINNQN